MPDDPHAPENRSEASFMLAAEASVQALQVQVEEAKEAAAEAKASADKANSQAKKWKWLTVGLGIVLALSLVLSGIGVHLWLSQQDATNQLRSQSTASCEIGNAGRAAAIMTWEKNYAIQKEEAQKTGSLLTQLVATLANNDPAKIKKIDDILAQSNAVSARENQSFLDFVKKTNKTRDCPQAYAPPNSAGPNSAP